MNLIPFHRRMVIPPCTYAHDIRLFRFMADNKILFSYPTPRNGRTAGDLPRARLTGGGPSFLSATAHRRVPCPGLALAHSAVTDSVLPSISISSAGQEGRTISRIPPILVSHTHERLHVSPLFRWSAPSYDFPPIQAV